MKGIIYALLATVSYSSTPTFTQMGYKAGIKTNTLLFSRHLVSLIFLLPTVLRKGSFNSVGKPQAMGLLVLSCFAIAGNLSFNYAYHYLPNMVSISVSLLYVIFVSIIEIIMGREKYTRKRGLIIGITALSMFVIALPDQGQIDMKAFMIGIFASLLYSTQVTIIGSKTMKDVPSNLIVLTSVIPIMIFSSIRCLMYREPLLPENGGQWFAIICLGTIGVILARGLFFEAIRLIGATKASMIDSLEPLSSLVLGYVFLDQIPTWNMLLGSAMMIVSVMMLLKEKSPEKGDQECD